LTLLEASGCDSPNAWGRASDDPSDDEYTFSARDTRQLAEKEAIGRACAELIQPNRSVIMDAGTTVFHVARYLESKLPQIVTNSLPIANLYASSAQLEVVMSGGVIYPRLGRTGWPVGGGELLEAARGHCSHGALAASRWMGSPIPMGC